MSEKNDFDITLIDVPELCFATLEHRGNPNKLGQSIAKFIEWRKINKLPPSKNRTFNLVYDDPTTTAAEDYRFDLCCAVDNPVEENAYGVFAKQMPAGKCALIRHLGSDDGLGVAIKYLYLSANNTLQ